MTDEQRRQKAVQCGRNAGSPGRRHAGIPSARIRCQASRPAGSRRAPCSRSASPSAWPRCRAASAASRPSGSAAGRTRSSVCARASISGIAAGSFWPSPSRVAIQVPRACLTPVMTPALCPQLSLVADDAEAARLRRAPVAGVAASHRCCRRRHRRSRTGMPTRAARISPMRGRMFGASLRTGTTTEINGCPACGDNREPWFCT